MRIGEVDLSRPGTRRLFSADEQARRDAREATAPAQPSRRPSGLRVKVVHGDLAAVDVPLLVGALDGTPIGGAERALDRRLGGALIRHRVLGQYPGPTGTCQLFARQGARGPAAAVVGMGDPGELTPGGLAAAVTQGVLRLCASRLDAATGQAGCGEAAREPAEATTAQPGGEAGGRSMVMDLEIAMVLIGTVGINALPVQSSASAIVTGVRRANRRLVDLDQPVRVAMLQLVELYEDRAVEALRAVTRLTERERAHAASALERLAVEERLQDGYGGLPGTPRADYQAEQWRTVRVGAAPGTAADSELVGLSFTSIGRSARAEQQVTTTQRKLIDQMVEQAITSPRLDAQMYNTLYELLVPNAMKGQGNAGENLMYVLDEHAARLPLEMLASRSCDDEVVPMAVEVGLVRRLETTQFRQRVRPATGTRALVIADPPTTKYLRLPGARAEGKQVAKALRAHGFEVTRLIPKSDDDSSVTVARIMNELFAHDYRIVHIAAHGNFDADPSRSGVLIGDGTFLTALEIQQMQTTADLVFLNCCHLGQMPEDGEPDQDRARTMESWRPDKLASSISRELIASGVRAVVAAGWAVDDHAAVAFAEEFYSRMLEGDNLGSAALSARSRVFEQYGHANNTWGAYQVYGPPAFQLVPGGKAGSKEAGPCSRRDLLEAVERLRRAAANADGTQVDALGQRLEDLQREAEPHWLGGEELQAIGEVWRALGEYAKATSAFEAALTQWGADASLKVVEGLVTVLARRGAELTLQRSADAAGKCFRQAEDLMLATRALVGQPTPKQLGMRGDFHRYRLLCTPQGQLTRRVRLAHQAYVEAGELFQQRGQQRGNAQPHPSYTVNALLFGWLVECRTGASVLGGDVGAVLEKCRSAARDAKCPDASTLLAVPDVELARHLIARDLPDHDLTLAVAAGYEAVFARGASRRDRLGVTEALAILERALPSSGPRAARVARIREALAAIRVRLEMWSADAPSSPVRVAAAERSLRPTG